MAEGWRDGGKKGGRDGRTISKQQFLSAEESGVPRQLRVTTHSSLAGRSQTKSGVKEREGSGRGRVRGASQHTSLRFLCFAPFSPRFNWPRGSETAAAHLHDDEEVKDQDEGRQEGPGDLVAGQEAPVQVVPADPVRADDQQHH